MNGAVRFDLSRGQVTMSEADAPGAARRAVIPVDALVTLCQGVSGDALANFGRRVGDEVGRRVADRLGSELGSAGAQTIVDHLGGELALMGVGSLQLELWGRALVFAIDQSSVLGAVSRTSELDDAGALLIAFVVEGAIARGVKRDVAVLPISRGGDEVRLLICSAAARDRVSNWLSGGCHYGEALARLNESEGAA